MELCLFPSQLLRVPDSLQELLKELCEAFNKRILAIITAEGGRIVDVDLIRHGFCALVINVMSSVNDCSRLCRDSDVLWVLEEKEAESSADMLGHGPSEHSHNNPRPMSVDGTHVDGAVDFSLKPCSTGPIVEGQYLLGLHPQ